MTQFKDKSSKVKTNNKTEKIPTGLLTYPALMAADILLYNPDIVPVGADQKQHIELTRNIATRFNNQYGNTMNVPEAFIPKEGAKIMSLTNPQQKMSKSSDQEKSYISLLDDPEIAAQKIRKAITDSENKVYISENKVGIVNLLTIYAGLKNITLAESEKECKELNYKEFKDMVAEEVKAFLINLQKKYNKAILNIDNIANNGSKKAQIVAQKN
jgi:tryptophanyl-tRNA synthetase